jgi:hypothetical protein
MISRIISVHPQKDGRTFVAEQHVDDYGIAHRFEYLAERDADWEKILEERARLLPAQLAAAELEQGFADLEKFDLSSLRYASKEQALAFVRERFRTAQGSEAAAIAAWLLRNTNVQERVWLFADALVPNVEAALSDYSRKYVDTQEKLNDIKTVAGF